MFAAAKDAAQDQSVVVVRDHKRPGATTVSGPSIDWAQTLQDETKEKRQSE